MKRLLLFVLMIMGCCGRFASDAKRCPATPAVAAPVEPLLVRPVLDDVRCRQWVDSVLDKLSLKERIGQLFIYTIAPYQDIWGIERSVFFNGREKWAKGFENQRV